MQNNWKTYKLGDLIKIKHGYAFKGEFFSDEANQNVLLTPGNFNSFGGIKFNWDKQKFYKGEIPKDYLLNKGDLIIALTDLTQSCSILGSTAIIKDSNYNYLHNQRLGLVKDINEKVDSNFLYYVFNNSTFRNHVIATKTGSTVSHTAPERIYNFEVKIPEDLQEQKSIASILSAIDDKIENNLAINKTLEEMAMALYKHWFVDFGPFQDGEFVESELGRIPKGWEVKKIKDFGEVVCGKTPSKKDDDNYSDIGYPFIKIPDMHNNIWVTNTIEKISEKGNRTQIKKLLPIGSINVSCIATVGLVSINCFPSHTNQQINSIIPSEVFYRNYLYLSMLSLKETFLNEASGGSATLNMNTSTFANVKLLKPNNTSLLEFDSLAFDLFENVKNNQLENQTLTQLRDTLLPKLISGEVRLKEFRE